MLTYGKKGRKKFGRRAVKNELPGDENCSWVVLNNEIFFDDHIASGK